jgi:hypothetical protein
MNQKLNEVLDKKIIDVEAVPIKQEQPGIQIQANLKGKTLFLGTPCYGGVTHGIFTKSVADLSALCVKYGIELKLFFLFNESLITRARNYVADEFVRAGGEHLMFIDSDIGFNPHDVLALMAIQSQPNTEYDIIGGPYAKKSLPADSLIETEDGPKKIKWIIDNKYTGKVLTINEETNALEWNKILQYHKHPNENKWVKVHLSNNFKRGQKIILTHDHEMASISDPLKPKIEMIQADKMLDCYSVVRTGGKFTALLNDDCVSAMIGTCLGDSYISKSDYRISCGHSDSQEKYNEHKSNMFKGKLREYNSKGYGNGKSVILSGLVNAQTKTLREKLYENNVKTIKNILPYLNEISLAYWYMDNGCLKKSGTTDYYCELNTQGFSNEDQELLVDFFREKYNINSKIDTVYPRAKHLCEEHESYKRLRFNNSDSHKFFELISTYVIESMNYKLPEEYHSIEKSIIDTKPLDIAATKVEKIEKIDLESEQYDIGVENNHNFVCNSVHIRNCISWEKIKVAVEKGFADDDPDVLGNFVGDYVFNPKSGAQQISLLEPAEVLEIGTGFMMIHKRVFEKWDQEYPQYLYKPDHVRTEAFDGSREIMQYFQAEIVNKRYLSEDYWFAQKSQDIGLKCWLCPWMKLQHAGSFIFGGSLVDLAQLGAVATADAGQLAEIKKKRKEKREQEKPPRKSA